MIIQETINRRCCDPAKGDLVQYKGVSGSDTSSYGGLKFCKYCGQIWIRVAFTDAAGDRDMDYQRVPLSVEPLSAENTRPSLT